MNKTNFLTIVGFAIFLILNITTCGKDKDPVSSRDSTLDSTSIIDTANEDTDPNNNGNDTPDETEIEYTDDRISPLEGLVFGEEFTVVTAVKFVRFGSKMIEFYSQEHDISGSEDYIGTKIEIDIGSVEFIEGEYLISDSRSDAVIAKFINIKEDNMQEELPASEGVIEILNVSETTIEGFLYAKYGTNNIVSGIFSAEILDIVFDF